MDTQQKTQIQEYTVHMSFLRQKNSFLWTVLGELQIMVDQAYNLTGATAFDWLPSTPEV